MKDISEKIDLLVKRIVSEVNPLRIILFGSAATGEMTEESDIDLLVIMPEGVHKRRTSQHLYLNIKNIDVPFDILVTTNSDLMLHKDDIGLIYKSILKEGKEVYAI